MAGNIKVGGNTIFTHTGAVGAGTVTLKDQSGNTILTDNGTAVSMGNLRLPTTGGIKDSSGNNVLSESGGVVTLGNASVNETFSGMMEVDQWYLTAVVGGGYITTNWARNNFTGFSKIGTGLTESSGVFSFPRTGVYEIISSFVFTESTGGNDANVSALLTVSVDNGSTFNNVNIMRSLHLDNAYETMSTSTFILNVNSISGSNAVKIQFLADSINSGNFISGSTSFMESNFTIKRLGPAQ